jgi:hypothetical protein
MKRTLILLLFPWFLLCAEEESTPSTSLDDRRTQEAECHDYYYGTRVTLAPFFLYQGQTTKKHKATFFGEADVFIPLFQTPQTILFAAVRGLDYTGAPIEGNFGLGVRHIFDQFDWMFGLYTFYDRSRSLNRNFFNQVTVGLELKTAKFTFDANGYIPFGKIRQRAIVFDETSLIDGTAPFKNILFKTGQEIALWGFDAEIGYNIWKDFSLFAGGFYFYRNQAAMVAGPFGRLYWTYDFGFTNPILFDQIHLELGGSYDKIRDGRLYAGIKFSWIIGARPDQKPKGIGKRMIEYVRRDYDIISTANKNESLQLLEKSPGSPVNVNIVTSFSELQTATGNGADVIALQGVATGTDGMTTLANSQTLTGKNYVFGDNVTIQLSTGGTFANEKIIVGTDNTIRDLTCNDLVLENGFPHGVGNCSLLNNHFINESNPASFFVISSTGPSHFYVKNNIFDCNAPNCFRIFVGEAATDVHVDEFTDNVFNMPSTLILGRRIGVEFANIIDADGPNDVTINFNIGRFTGNTFNLVANQSESAAIVFACGVTEGKTGIVQTFNVDRFEENKVVVSGAVNALNAIVVLNEIDGIGTQATQTFNIKSCSSNTIQIGDANFNRALFVQNAQIDGTSSCVQKINITELISNEVIVEAGTSNSGMYFLNSPGGSTTPNITIGGANVGGFFNNRITFGTGSTESIVFDNNGSGTMNVTINNFGQDLETSNFNAQVTKTGTNAAGITITP